MVREDYWRLAGVPIDGHAGAESVHTVGESYSLSVELTSESDAPTNEWPDHISRYEELRSYRRYAGSYTTFPARSGKLTFVPDHSGGLSLLVALEPPADTRTGIGMWGLIAGMEDQTTFPSKICELDVELLFVADLRRYATREQARQAHELESPV